MNLYKKEPKAPEVMYAYLHKCHMDADDCFDDEQLVKDIEREQEMQESIGQNQKEDEIEEDVVVEDGADVEEEYYTDEELDLSGEAKDVFFDENDKARAEILRMTEMEKLFKMVFYDGEWRTPTVVRLMEESKAVSPPAP